MLDIRLIREQPDEIKTRLATRGADLSADVDAVLACDADRRRSETDLPAAPPTASASARNSAACARAARIPPPSRRR